MVCVETRYMKAVLKAQQMNKSNRNDARRMAQMMRVGLCKRVHVKTLVSRHARMLLTSRKLLRDKRHVACGAAGAAGCPGSAPMRQKRRVEEGRISGPSHGGSLSLSALPVPSPARVSVPSALLQWLRYPAAIFHRGEDSHRPFGSARQGTARAQQPS